MHFSAPLIVALAAMANAAVISPSNDVVNVGVSVSHTSDPLQCQFPMS